MYDKILQKKYKYIIYKIIYYIKIYVINIIYIKYYRNIYIYIIIYRAFTTIIMEYSIRIAYTRIIECPVDSHWCFPRHSMGTKRDLRRLLHLARKLKTRGKTRSADICHEHRWSSPSLTSHFQPISRISSTFRIVLAIARFHAPSGRDWNWQSPWRQNKTKIRTIAFDRDAHCGAARMLHRSFMVTHRIVILYHAITPRLRVFYVFAMI